MSPAPKRTSREILATMPRSTRASIHLACGGAPSLASSSHWLVVSCRLCRRGAKRPMRVPRFVGRLFAGEFGVALMTELRGASNAKARRELAWRPAHASWRQGLVAA